MRKSNLLFAVLLSFVIVFQGLAQTREIGNADFLSNLMMNDLFFKPYLENPGKFEIQIIYTQIDRDSSNLPHFTQYNYQVDNKKFFNPASLVKWPLILLGMEKVNNLNPSLGITLYSKVGKEGDYLSPDKTHRLANDIKEMILVSDDRAYNRMYDFLGQEYINKRLAEMGYDSLRVMLRFTSCTREQNRTTPSIYFYDERDSLLYEQPATINPVQLSNPLGTVIKGGKDFSYFNNMSLQDINDLMFFVFFKEAAPLKKRFNLTAQDYELLYKYTAMYPYESEFPLFKSNHRKYPVHLKKYLYYGKNSAKPNLPGLEIHNMVGQSHGTLSDVAYFVHPEAGVEFMLSAVINTCDGPINPANYHYLDRGQPFLEKLGKMIYQYELQRHKN